MCPFEFGQCRIEVGSYSHFGGPQFLKMGKERGVRASIQ